MLENLLPIEQLRGLATRRSKPDDYKTVKVSDVDGEVAKGWEIVKHRKSSARLKHAKQTDKFLEDRVWVLLYRMGFKYLSGLGGAKLALSKDDPLPSNQVDVVAVDDEVALAVECKSSKSQRKYVDFTSDLARHAALRERFREAIKSKFPDPARRTHIFAIWISGRALSENDRIRAEQAGVVIFDEDELQYYEQLVAQIGPAARFQFLADVLRGRQVPGLALTVPAMRMRMGKYVAYSFSVPPEYLLKISFVSHRARGKPSDIDAYQRMLKKSRLRDIRQYISEGGIFPTNIVVNIANQSWLDFDRGKQEGDQRSATLGWLNIRPAYKAAWIIDGQHRLFAYAGHPLAGKSQIAVMAFVGLPPSEQARLFVDINAEQRKVKQNLLQELYAELHWDAADPVIRVQAILSKAIQSLDSDDRSPFHNRILKADESRTDTRCISLTSLFKAMERGEFFIARMKKGVVVEFGPLWAVDNMSTLRRTIRVLSEYFGAIRQEVQDIWGLGAGDGGGLAMNDGVTVCTNVLRSAFHHLLTVRHVPLGQLSDDELVEQVKPCAKLVGSYFASMPPEALIHFRALRGVQGQTTGTRRVEEFIRRSVPTFDPPGLREFLERQRSQTTTRAFQSLTRIETILQSNVVGELKNEFGTDELSWWFNGVPKGVRKKVDDRINEEGGKKGGREENFDLIDYRDIAVENWQLFEGTLARGKGSKDKRTKWIVDVNELRKSVMHASKGVSLPITEEQLAFLEEVEQWLRGQVEAEGEGEGVPQELELAE